MKKIFASSFLFLFLLSFCPVLAFCGDPYYNCGGPCPNYNPCPPNYHRIPARYRYAYQNPPRKNIGAYGHFIYISSGVRYVNSASRLKNLHHAARIDAYNRMYQ